MRDRLAALLGAIVLLAAARPGPTPFDLDRIGRTAPPLVIPLADGSPLDVRSLRGKPVYVFLFASWCEPCALAMPWVRRAYAAYGDRVQFVGIDVLDSPANAQAFVQAQQLPFAVGIVPESAIDVVANPIARQDGGAKYQLPADYLIDANGIVRAAWHGVPVERDGTPIDVLPQALSKAGFTSDSGASPPP
jgi:peroxiredoxin